MQKKNLHGGPNDASRVVWASYRRRCKHLRVFKYVISTYTYELIQKKHVERKNYSPRAQTTRDASSGHFSPVRLCPNPRCRCRCRRCRCRCRAVVVLVVVLLLHRRCRACYRCRG